MEVLVERQRLKTGSEGDTNGADALKEWGWDLEDCLESWPGRKKGDLQLLRRGKWPRYTCGWARGLELSCVEGSNKVGKSC